jgi:hypothetical protein
MSWSINLKGEAVDVEMSLRKLHTAVDMALTDIAPCDASDPVEITMSGGAAMFTDEDVVNAGLGYSFRVVAEECDGECENCTCHEDVDKSKLN